jgi:hypothetical protein
LASPTYGMMDFAVTLGSERNATAAVRRFC